MNFLLKKLTDNIKIIDTLTTKLLMLVLFVVIIPLIVSVNFSSNIIGQNVQYNLANKLNLYNYLYKEKNNFEFNKLEIIANTNLEERKFLSKENLYNVDFMGIVNKNHVSLFQLNKYNYNINKTLNNLINYSLRGKVVKSFELLRGNAGFDIVQVVSIPVFNKKNNVVSLKIIGKRLSPNNILILNNEKWKIKLHEAPYIEKNNKKIVKLEAMKNFDNKTIGIISFETMKDSFTVFIKKNAEITNIISVVSLFVSIAIAALFSRSLTTPVLNLVNAAEIISSGNLTHRVQNKGNDEIAKLSESFNKMAKSLQAEKQLRDNFITTLTHDLKVPMLAENRTISCMLKEMYGAITDEQREILELIKSTNNASLEMVITLLDIYKYENGCTQLVKSEFNIVNLIKTAIEEIKSLALDKKISIDIEFPKDEVLLFIDNREIKRVLHNLISNSITNGNQDGYILCKIEIIDSKRTYYPEQKGKMCHTLLSPIDISNSILITVKDNGTGIADVDVIDLFKRFSPGKGRKPASSGIGLYYCNQVISRHNGHIWVESIPDKGSEFKFTIPFC